jgi:hypothetical protein
MPGPAHTPGNPVVLLASAQRLVTTGTNSTPVDFHLPDGTSPHAMQFELDLTAAATDAADTLDVQVQTSLDDVNFINVCHFTQCLGNGGAKRHVAKILAAAAETMFEGGATLAAGSVRNIIGHQFRVNWVIVDADLDGYFTFSVTAVPL